jgi:hypothetical protein
MRCLITFSLNHLTRLRAIQLEWARNRINTLNLPTP